MSIRQFINLVEDAVEEAFKPPKLAEPTDPFYARELERCRQYRSAESYAHSHYNPVAVRNTDHDGSPVRRLYNVEVNKMISRWNYYQKIGLI